MFIDTHSHLYSKDFSQDQKEMVQRAINAGVQKMLLPNIDLESITGMHDLCAAFPSNIFPMMGLHPCDVKSNWEEVLAEMHSFLLKNKYVAVGEIGMDLYWDKTFVDEQKKAFGMQIKWAKEMNLPIVIHARDAFDEIFEVMDRLYDERLTGVFHCFTGEAQEVNKILNDYPNFYFGIGGVITYKKSTLSEVVQLIPREKLVLETDAPYLAPVPFRGKRNESAYLVHTAEKLADALNLSLLELAQITTKNAERLFPRIVE